MQLDSEKDLYEPVRQALRQRFAEKGECHLEVTATGISQDIRRLLDDSAVYILEIENKKPDLLGYVVVKSESGFESKRLIVAEVKKASLTLDDIYQVKMYAEMFDARYAFLISPTGFKEARRRFLRHRWGVLSIGGTYERITVMRLLEDGSLELDEELCHSNPFLPEK